MKRAAKLALAGLSLLLGLGGATRLALQRQLPGQTLQKQLSQSLGYPLRFSSYELTWDAQLRVLGLEVLAPSGEVFLKVDQAQVQFDRNLALQGKLKILDLRLLHPQLKLSGKIWKSLQRPGKPGQGRDFPLLLRDLDLAWLHDDGRPTWEIKGWQGSLPPVRSGHWKVALQGPEGASLDGAGNEQNTELRLTRFPVSMLATVATGAQYPSLESSAQVSLKASWAKQTWTVQADLQAAAFTGPIHLTLGPGRRGQLASPTGGKLSQLGQVGPFQLHFEPTADGWKVSQGQMRWRNLDWSYSAEIAEEDPFSGHLTCKQNGLLLDLKGSARQQKADFVLSIPYQKKPARAQGRIDRAGLHQIQMSWSGWKASLDWDAISGAISLQSLPLQLKALGPGWSGGLSLKAEGRYPGPWKMESRTSGAQTPLGKLTRLDGQYDQGKLQAVAQLGAYKVLLEGPPRELIWRVSTPYGGLQVRSQWGPPWRLTLKHSIKYKGVSLPQLTGSLVGSGTSWKGESLHLNWNQWKLPLQAEGNLTPQSWKLESQFKELPFNWQGIQSKLAGTARLNQGTLQFQGQLTALQFNGQHLGDWTIEARRGLKSPAQIKLVAPNLRFQGVSNLKARAAWKEGQKWLEGSLSHSKVIWEGLSLGPLSLRLRFYQSEKGKSGPQRVEILPSQLGQSRFTGQFEPHSKRVSLKAQIRALSLRGWKLLPLATSATLNGQLQLNGNLPKPNLQLSGNLSEVSALGYKFAQIPIRLDPSKVQVGPWPVSWSGFQTQLSVQLTADKKILAQARQLHWQNHPAPDAQVEGSWSGLTLSSAKVTWLVQPPLVLEGKLSATPDLRGELKGHSLEQLCLGKWPVRGKVSGSVSYSSGVHFEGRVQDLAAAGQALGSGQITFSSEPKLVAEAKGFQAQQVALLQDRYPGLSGQIEGQMNGPEIEGKLTLKGAHWRGSDFPALSLQFRSDAKSISLDPLEVGLQPPLRAQGRLWPATKRMELHGQLSGQSLAQLALLAGGGQPPDLQAQLFGPFGLGQDSLQFSGQARELRYRGVTLGSGQLELQATPQLAGQLLLDHPLELSSLGSAVPNSLQGVLPQMGVTLLGSLKLRGVKLSGSLDQPSVSPIWSGPNLRLPF